MKKPAGISHKVTSGETVCPYCGVGCRLWGEVAYDEVLRVKGVPEAPANLGGICAKGATLGDTVRAIDRLIRPMRRTHRSSSFRETTMENAIGEIAGRLAEIIGRHGPDAVAFYGSGQLDSQTVYCITKLFKGRIGTNNTDSNSRLCMATAVSAYRTNLGSDGPPTCYEDIDEADLIVIVGSNMAEAHPVTFDRIRAARRARSNLKLAVIDPRRTLTADQADIHLSVKPGQDITLLNALGRLLLDRGRMDEAFVREHVDGFDDYKTMLDRIDLNQVESRTGVSLSALERLVDAFAPNARFLSFYCMGMGQSTVGTWKINSLINLHLLTGSMGRAGCGPFSLTGQPNAMGGREGGLLSHQLPGYRFVDNAQHRNEVEKYWRLPAGAIRPQPGLTAVEMFRALEKGTLKALWIAGTNPLFSMPDLHQTRRALEKAELVVVQDAFHPTETTVAADILLPVASWAEREWVSTNSERMVAHSEKLVDPPGDALPDWELLCRVARKMGYEGFDFESPGEVWDEWIGLTKGRLCDMSGMPHWRLASDRNLQWPCPSVDHPGTKRLYLDHRFPTENGRAKFQPREDRDPKETTDHEFPLSLTTGRVYSHWHSMTRTGKARKLMLREPDPFLQVHPNVAEPLGINDGDVAQLSSRRGTVRLPVRITDRVPPDTVFAPMHWGDLFSGGNGINYLTLSAIGRIAKQPELKHCAVAIEKVPRQNGDNGMTS